MAEDWKDLPLHKKLFANLDPDAVVGYQTAIENGFINDLGGHTRFPGLILRVDLGGNGRVYLHDFDGDLMAATSQGKVYRIDRSYTATDVTGVPVSGGRRVIFAKTDRDLLMAAGGPMVRLRDQLTELLTADEDAPLASHVVWLDNFTIAIEVNSGRFFHAEAGTPDVWDPLDSFSADGNPDNINSVIVTPFRELLLGGESSIEQFERLTTNGAVPFFRRWAIGEGVKLPYAILHTDSATWTINGLNQFVRFSGQTSQVASQDVGRVLQKIDDWTDAWIGGYPDSPLDVNGQNFIMLQMPKATNAYGTKGVTLLYDYRQKRWSTLYGWDSVSGTPARWPAWSHWRLWDKVFVGNEGKIFELSDESYRNGDDLQRWLVRTSHIAADHAVEVKAFRLQMVRGRGTPSTASKIRVRCSRDSKPFSRWIERSLGTSGQNHQMLEFGSFGTGSTHLFEIACTDDTPVDLIKAQVKTEARGF